MPERFPRHDSEVVQYVETSEQDEVRTDEQLAEEVLENERAIGLVALCSERLTLEDAEFIDGLDSEEEVISYMMCAIASQGEDPEEVLIAYGVLERSEDV